MEGTCQSLVRVKCIMGLCKKVREVELNEQMGKTCPFHEDLINTSKGDVC